MHPSQDGHAPAAVTAANRGAVSGDAGGLVDRAISVEAADETVTSPVYDPVIDGSGSKVQTSIAIVEELTSCLFT